MKIKPLMFCGILAPIVYVRAVVLGGVLRPGYSHVLNFVSDLIGTGAPNKCLLDPLFGLHNLFCLAFGLGAFLLARASLGNSRRIVGLTGAQVTSIGMTYIVLAGLSSLAPMASMLLLGLWFRGDQSIKGCHGSQSQPDGRSGGASHDRRILAVAAGDSAVTPAGTPGGRGGLRARTVLAGLALIATAPHTALRAVCTSPSSATPCRREQ